jgi:hypothetical protein
MARLSRYLMPFTALSMLVSGCALQPAITPEQQATHALLVSDISKNAQASCGEPGNPLNCLYLGYVDGNAPGLASTQIVVAPGNHVISTVWSHGVFNNLPSAPLVFPSFNYRAGHRYVLSVGAIYDTAWSDPEHPILATYILRDGDFVDQRIAAGMDNAKAQADELAFREQQERDMPHIMKKGAEVCLRGGNGIANHGFVEDVTNDKIEIHLSSWQGNDRDIWDLPQQWFLCGHN